MNIAIIYDRVNTFGGAERVLLSLHKLYPEAPLFTSVYDPIEAPWADDFDVRPSFVSHIPFARSHHRLFPWLMPLAFETLNLNGFDVVISVSSAEAKNVITRPGQVHICYCLTPTRYLWSGRDEYETRPGLGVFSSLASQTLKKIGNTLRNWDEVASARPDYYVAISDRVSERIETYYHRTVEEVIFPPVDVSELLSAEEVAPPQKDFFLVVSRFVGYKRIDLIIEACNALNLPLIVIGRGPGEAELRSISGKNVTFVTSHLTDSELGAYYRNCRAYISAADEDFGIAAVEAQALGAPVVAYKHSGIAQIVQNGKTGILFEKQTVESLKEVLASFQKSAYTRSVCEVHARRFSEEVFLQKFDALVRRLTKSI